MRFSLEVKQKPMSVPLPKSLPLFKKGLSRLKGLDAQGCCLVGHPECYKRFGFKNITGRVHEGVPEEVFFALSLDGHVPQGIAEFHEGFKANGQQEGAALGWF